MLTRRRAFTVLRRRRRLVVELRQNVLVKGNVLVLEVQEVANVLIAHVLNDIRVGDVIAHVTDGRCRVIRATGAEL